VTAGARLDPKPRDVLLLAVSVAGLAACLTLMFYAMRAVMDVGGYCAEGGPYVIEQHCPEGSAPALLLGIFGLFGFGGLGMYAGAKAGGYGWVPLLAWTGLFASLGWNFLDYGLFSPPEGEGIIWGWLIPGVMFQVMAWAPLAVGLAGLRAMSGTAASSRARAAVIVPNALRGPGQPARDAARPSGFAGVTAATSGPVAVHTTVQSVEMKPDEAREALRDIASLMGAAVADAAAETPMDPDLRAAPTAAMAGGGAAAGLGGEADFSEGTQALLDRLERLADMRDRGLLGDEEFETAKEAIMRELESRS
jgi:hypothetical protein